MQRPFLGSSCASTRACRVRRCDCDGLQRGDVRRKLDFLQPIFGSVLFAFFFLGVFFVPRIAPLEQLIWKVSPRHVDHSIAPQSLHYLINIGHVYIETPRTCQCPRCMIILIQTASPHLC
jgi:hypothetical protein